MRFCESIPERVADCLVPLCGDGDDHVDGGGLDESLVGVDEVGEGHAVPQRGVALLLDSFVAAGFDTSNLDRITNHFVFCSL